MASAEAFALLKIAGAAYLLWLGLKTWREAHNSGDCEIDPTSSARAFRDGVLVEALNPKTAAIFLAFIPQFIDASGSVAHQFIAFGLVSVALNMGVDVIVTYWAAKARDGLARRPSTIVRMRKGSAAVLRGLGATLMFARRTT